MFATASFPWQKKINIGRQRLLPVLVLTALAVLQQSWSQLAGYQFNGWSGSLLIADFLLVLAVAYGWTERNVTLSNMAYFGALWVAFTGTGAISTYFAAGLGYPLLDATFARWDAALGFDWLAYYDFIKRHAMLHVTLESAYGSLRIQILLAVIYLCATGKHQRNYELWWAALLALAATTVLSGLYPAAGTFQHYGIDMHEAIHLPHFDQLRAGVDHRYAVADMKGIVTFPSYHMVLAVLFTHAFRGTGLFYPVAALNALMMLATPVFGGHYLVDMLAGGVIALLTVWLVRACPSLSQP